MTTRRQRREGRREGKGESCRYLFEELTEIPRDFCGLFLLNVSSPGRIKSLTGEEAATFVKAGAPSKCCFCSCFELLIKLPRDNNQIAAVGVNGTSEPRQESFI